jgi:hypothetical protein
MKSCPCQTKIWEARTSLSECAFEALFKGMSTQFGRRIVDNCFENALGKVGSGFPNLSLQYCYKEKRRIARMHHAQSPKSPKSGRYLSTRITTAGPALRRGLRWPDAPVAACG